jgi:hypothetical protein
MHQVLGLFLLFSYVVNGRAAPDPNPATKNPISSPCQGDGTWAVKVSANNVFAVGHSDLLAASPRSISGVPNRSNRFESFVDITNWRIGLHPRRLRGFARKFFFGAYAKPTIRAAKRRPQWQSVSAEQPMPA